MNLYIAVSIVRHQFPNMTSWVCIRKQLSGSQNVGNSSAGPTYIHVFAIQPMGDLIMRMICGILMCTLHVVYVVPVAVSQLTFLI